MKKIQNLIFRSVHGKKLVYNTCWEDPRCDRKLLQLDNQSQVVVITSAGDNALDYLLDDPARIHAIDMNHRQNALLELKCNVLAQGDHSLLFEMFGKGNLRSAKKIYKNKLRSGLKPPARRYWDQHINYFRKRGFRKSFYYRGTSGALAWWVKNYIQLRKSVKRGVEQLLESRTIQEQIENYYKVEQKLFNPLVRLLLNQHCTMVLAGVPKAQQALIQQDYAGGNVEYIQESLRNTFTRLEVGDNYFYQVYLNGFYTKDCCPEYLKRDHFQVLKKRQERIATHTTTISEFLKKNPGEYSHYVLLDHQDWLAAHDIPALEEEWRLILENSKPGTRILMRSAARQVDFFPDFVLKKITFEKELMEEMHQQDRVGTYASVYLGVVN